MFNKNLKYYRLKNHLTKKALASKCGLSAMNITHYENGTRKPSMENLKLLAEALDVRVSDFLTVRDESLVFTHGEFRKTSALRKNDQEFIRESVEEYFSRFFTAVELLGGEVLPEAPECHAIHLSGDAEEDSINLRRHLGLADDGPIDDLIGVLENKGILIFVYNIGNDKFSGMNGLVNDRPYIVINENMSTERNRSTIVHELAHLMFIWPDDMEEKAQENHATAISGAFLFPKQDAIRELGVHRRGISKDMEIVCKEYGISMYLLVRRAQLSSIISKDAERNFYIWASQQGWRKGEPSRIKKEKPSLFEQLVYRAVNEQEISIQRGAELLHMSYNDIVKQCCFNGDNEWNM